MLARLLRAALSVNVSVALGGGPDAGAAYEIVTRQAAPDGRVVDRDVAPFEQVIGPTANGVPAGEISAPLNVSPVTPSPASETVITCVPTAPAPTLPNPRLLVEKDATGTATLIRGVIVTTSFTIIVSSSTTSALTVMTAMALAVGDALLVAIT